MDDQATGVGSAYVNVGWGTPKIRNTHGYEIELEIQLYRVRMRESTRTKGQLVLGLIGF